jgi:N-formylglutamate amidohydrolase
MTTNKYPILVSIPHGSIFVPKDLRKLMKLTDFQIKKQSDPFTDEIFDVPNAHIIKGRISRLVVDLNRAPDDIEMEHELSNKGVVVSVDIDGNQIYKTPPSLDVISDRVQKYHYAFHEKIDELKPQMRFMIDGHSMRSVTPATKPESGRKRADIVLGNRHYTTCSRTMTRNIMKFFEDRGFSVKVNDPFTGRFIIGYHCSRSGFPGIQIEVNERLFMNTKTYRPREKDVQALKHIMAELMEYIAYEIQKSDEALKKGQHTQSKLF